MTQVTATRQPGEAQPGGVPAIVGILSRYAPAVCLVLLMIVFAILEPNFLSPLNLFNVMRQISIEGLIAIGMTFVDSHGGHRPFRGITRRGRRARRGDHCQGQHRKLVLAEHIRGAGLWLVCRHAWRHSCRHDRRRDPRNGDHHAQGATFRGDARRAFGLQRAWR